MEAAHINTLAVAFVVLRVLHGLCYVTGLAVARSLIWFGGIGCVVTLMLQALIRIA